MLHTDAAQPECICGVTEQLSGAADKTSRQDVSEKPSWHIFDHVPHMIWLTRPDGHHDYFSKRWYEFTGVPEGSTDGEEWNGVFHPEDQPEAWSRWRHSLKTGEPYEIKYRLRHHSGEYRWVLGRALPERDLNGRILRWYGTCTDIHDKILAEQELARTAENFRRILDGLPVMVWSASADGSHDYANQRFDQFIGHSIAGLNEMDGAVSLIQNRLRLTQLGQGWVSLS